ncbi:hypothetical protein [Terracidiphilus sp.]|uniref:hypothetical protein n=1 Tax=Terracidiphilus sp. TaxID=1964191 RepID=UPI003C14E7D7
MNYLGKRAKQIRTSSFILIRHRFGAVVALKALINSGSGRTRNIWLGPTAQSFEMNEGFKALVHQDREIRDASELLSFSNQIIIEVNSDAHNTARGLMPYFFFGTFAARLKTDVVP